MIQSFKPLHGKLLAGSACMVLAVISAPLNAQTQEELPATQQAASNHFDEDQHEIRFRADTLIISPVMSVGLVESAATVVRGEDVRFQTYTNYPSFIARGEIRIYAAGASPDSEPLFMLDLEDDGSTATIPMVLPRCRQARINASIRVDLPTPGGPVSPREKPTGRAKAASSRSAVAGSSGFASILASASASARFPPESRRSRSAPVTVVP